jgi:hypothetical protein
MVAAVRLFVVADVKHCRFGQALRLRVLIKVKSPFTGVFVLELTFTTSVNDL